MTRLTCRIATTPQQLDDALRVRWEVFGAELAMLGRSAHALPRENNGFDTLATTTHIIVYADGVPVATTRLLLPNLEVARATGRRLGIDLESGVRRDRALLPRTGSARARGDSKVCACPGCCRSSPARWGRGSLPSPSMTRVSASSPCHSSRRSMMFPPARGSCSTR